MSGAGHLIRSIALSEQAVSMGHSVVFCGHFDTEFARTAISSRGFKSIDFDGDSEDLARLASQEEAHLVHVDDYRPRTDLHEILSGHGIPLSSMEDGVFGARSADLIIDPSAGAEEALRAASPSSIHLRGLQYAPFRKSILAAAGIRQQRSNDAALDAERPFQVLIILGGTDAAGASRSLATLWASSVPASVCYVVTPGVDEYIEQVGETEVHWLVPSEETVTSLFRRVDAVISAAGTTVWELAALGIPAAVVMQAENQRANYEYVVSNSSMYGLGSVDELSSNDTTVRGLMKRLGSREYLDSRDIAVDLYGAASIVAVWGELALAHQTTLSLRYARLSDASNLFEWRNDDLVRSSSLDARSLTWNNHLTWLRSVLHDPQRKLLIATRGRSLCGTVRFDRLSQQGTWEVSLALNPAMRGQGLGSSLLAAAEKFLHSELLSPYLLKATVKVNNEASNRLFLRSGYIQDLDSNANSLNFWYKSVT